MAIGRRMRELKARQVKLQRSAGIVSGLKTFSKGIVQAHAALRVTGDSEDTTPSGDEQEVIRDFAFRGLAYEQLLNGESSTVASVATASVPQTAPKTVPVAKAAIAGLSLDSATAGMPPRFR